MQESLPQAFMLLRNECDMKDLTSRSEMYLDGEMSSSKIKCFMCCKFDAGTQGLAPHYDDVDLWVCQTMGSKQWKIYKSPEGYQLPAVSSTDFQQSELGEPVLEATLEVRMTPCNMIVNSI